MNQSPLKKWESFRELMTLREDMDRFFNNFFGRSAAENYEGVWTPVLDIEEDKDNFIVRAELPGLRKEDIKISVRGSLLALTGERAHKAEEKDKTFHRIERSYGKFVRHINLPNEIDESKVKAAYQDGILTVILPKPEAARPREVQVEIK